MATTYVNLIGETRPLPTEISLDEVRRRLDSGESMILLDVREEEEVFEGKIPGAIHIPRGRLEAEMPSRYPDKTAHIVVYCASGSRAALAAKTLVALGYDHVEHASSGFLAWRGMGLPVAGSPSLTDMQRERYSRHLLLREVGETGQVTLLASRILILGAGGLGSPAALYLAAAGVGTIGIVDSDVVELSNLQRQLLHTTTRIGRPKVESAAATIGDLNPEVHVIPYKERLNPSNVERLFADYDLVVDGTDNFATRYLVNDAAVTLGKPVVHGSVFRFEGRVTTFLPPRACERFALPPGPCYRCLHPEPPVPELAPNCQEAGVLGVLCGVIGSLQATEALKLLLRRGRSLVGRVLFYDGLEMTFREVRLKPNPECAACSPRAMMHGYGDSRGVRSES